MFDWIQNLPLENEKCSTTIKCSVRTKWKKKYFVATSKKTKWAARTTMDHKNHSGPRSPRTPNGPRAGPCAMGQHAPARATPSIRAFTTLLPSMANAMGGCAAAYDAYRGFFFFIFKKNKISKIYVRFGKFQKYTPAATCLKCNFFSSNLQRSPWRKKKGLSPP